VKVGFVGLGAMGTGIVPRLMAGGHEVTGWNRTRGKAEALIAQGMRWGNTPREVARESEIVFSIVTDAEAVKEVALGPDGVIAGLAKGGIFADMSTISPIASRAIAAEFAKADMYMLDAPISASTKTLADGKASIMVGGDRGAFERAWPVMLAIGPKVSYIGGSGLAAQMKIAMNLTLITQVISFCEGVAMAERGGVDRAVAVDAMLKSVVASPVLGYRGPCIIEGTEPTFAPAPVDFQQKDMVVALDLARRMGMPIPVAAAANEMMNAGRGLGPEECDFVVSVYEAYRRMGGKSR
jgi:3-hydroxyisobutyrate dehydrogenase-like beta-hydroxyacid dehydrogenase